MQTRTQHTLANTQAITITQTSSSHVWPTCWRLNARVIASNPFMRCAQCACAIERAACLCCAVAAAVCRAHACFSDILKFAPNVCDAHLSRVFFCICMQAHDLSASHKSPYQMYDLTICLASGIEHANRRHYTPRHDQIHQQVAETIYIQSFGCDSVATHTRSVYVVYALYQTVFRRCTKYAHEHNTRSTSKPNHSQSQTCAHSHRAVSCWPF